MCTSSAVNYVDIDYTLGPEPDYKGSLEENGCLEWSQWEHAREEELAAMRKFGVYRVVKRHEARGDMIHIIPTKLCQKFEIKPDEGAPIDYLLGMLIKQDLKKQKLVLKH